MPDEFGYLEIDKDKIIEFFSVVPLYEEEMNLKPGKGSDLLLDKFEQYDISDIIIADRINVAKKRFGIF